MNTKEKIALYAMSGDPFTRGHEDIVKRATKQFDKVIVGIGANPDKTYMFSLQERREMAKDALLDVMNVEVIDFQGLLVTFAAEQCVDVVVRGIRNATDMEAEKTLAEALNTQGRGIESIYLLADRQKEHISSSAAKAILKENGKIQEFVRLPIKQRMEAKMNKYYSIGITWSIGSGKTYIGNKLTEFGNKFGIPTTNVEMDKIAHKILWSIDGITLEEPIYLKARKDIIAEFGEGVRMKKGDTIINRHVLGQIVFNNPDKRRKLNQIMQQPISVRLERMGYKKQWLHLINSALIVESEDTYLTNNNVIVIDADIEAQKQRIRSRSNLTEEQIETRINSQFSNAKKKELLSKQIARDSRWEIISFDNSKDIDQQNMEKLFFDTLSIVDIDAWLRVKWLFKRTNIPGNHEELFKELQLLYNETENFHHNRLHVVDCLNDFYHIRYLADNPEMIERAIIFHDIVYKPGRQDNEEASAKVAGEYLRKFGFSEEYIQQVQSLIMVTKNHREPQTIDEKIMIDLDLSILGKGKKFYTRYTNNIKDEYKRSIEQLSEKTFNQGRCDFLEEFLKRDTIFYTEYFIEKYWAQAKENMKNEYNRLKSRLSNLSM